MLFLTKAKDLFGNGNYVFHVKERNMWKNNCSCLPLTDSVIKFYAKKKQAFFNQKTLKWTVLSAVDMYSFVKDHKK